jgi:hypothetical protein
MNATLSTEKREKSLPCKVFPFLGYLRSHLHLFLKETDEEGKAEVRLSNQPLLYSFYLQNVLEPYRSHLAEASAPSTSFCYLERVSCKPKPNEIGCDPATDPLVSLPNSDATSVGKCVFCSDLQLAIQAGSVKDEASIRDLKATCHPISSRGPNPSPERKTKDDVRWLRWFLQSSYVFEGKKVGEKCSASPALIKVRFHLELLMGKQLDGRRDNVSLAAPGKEGGEKEERRYEGVFNEEMNDDEGRRKWWGEKLGGIQTFGEVFCWR